MAYFSSSSIHTGFHDRPDGFYAVYRSLFERLREQELTYQHHYQQVQSKSSTDADAEIPWTTLGTSTTNDYDTLNRFYSYWTNFSTCIRFSWTDMYNLARVRNLNSFLLTLLGFMPSY
jgi:DnaJ family protein A protein 5